MIIDIHAHTFPDRIAADVISKLGQAGHVLPFSDATNGSLQTLMCAQGIDYSVVLPVATSVRQVEKLNDASAKLNENEAFPGILSFGCMHPDYEGYREELSRVKSLGLGGIKLHPVYQGVDLDDIRYLRIISRAAELGLIVLTHAGLDVGFPGEVRCTPRMSRHVVDEIGDFPFVLAHMGGWRSWEEVPEYLADTKVYLDTSFSTGRMTPRPDGYWKEEDRDMLDAAGFLKLVQAFGADRILFGTDSPWGNQSEILGFMEKLPLPEADKKKILGENAVKLLKL